MPSYSLRHNFMFVLLQYQGQETPDILHHSLPLSGSLPTLLFVKIESHSSGHCLQTYSCPHLVFPTLVRKTQTPLTFFRSVCSSSNFLLILKSPVSSSFHIKSVFVVGHFYVFGYHGPLLTLIDLVSYVDLPTTLHFNFSVRHWSGPSRNVPFDDTNF